MHTKKNKAKKNQQTRGRDKSARARRVAEKRAGTASPARDVRPQTPSSLTTLARDVGRVPLLDAEGEQRMARELEAGEIHLWSRILAYAPMVEVALDKVRDTAGEPEVTRALAQAAGATGASRDEVVRRTAEAMRAMDRDRHALDAVMAELSRMERGEAALPAGATPDELARLGAAVRARARKVTRVRNAFVEANLRLVFAIAAQHARGDVPLADLVQEGSLGLMTAVNRFDHRRGLRFSTYAAWWIRHMIGRAIADKARTVRVPVYLRDSKQRLERIRRDFMTRLGRAPSDEELAAASGYSLSRLRSVRARAASHEISLDQTLGEGEAQPRHEVFRDPHSTHRPADQELALRQDVRRLESALHTLSAQEADILRKRFALDDDHEWTLQEIARRYGVSRERIRQLQNRALSKMRAELARLDAAAGR